MELLDSLKWRYATKQFDSEKTLTEDQVNQLLEAANLSATSYGLQPFKFLVIHDQAKQDQLVASSYGQAQVAQASHVIVIATRTDVDADYISAYVDLIEKERGLDGGAMDQFKAVMTGAITGMDAHSRPRRRATDFRECRDPRSKASDEHFCPSPARPPELQTKISNLHLTLIKIEP